jgi:hypothetical protein
MDSVLAIGPNVLGFCPGRGLWMKGYKNPQPPSFGGEVKLSGPMS